MKALIFSVQRFSLYDGPGIRTTLFFKGCPLRCRWCHNPESISPRPQRLRYPALCIGCGRCRQVCPAPPCTGCLRCAQECPTGALVRSGEYYTPQEALKAALEDRPFYGAEGGVTFSGGEPLRQYEAAAEMARILRDQGIPLAVDTCGHVPWEAFEAMLPLTDLFLYDLKAWDSGVHRELTGVGNERILDNLDHLVGRGARLWLRIPVIPGVNEDQLEPLARHIRGLPAERVELMAYHDTARDKYAALGLDYPLREVRPPDSSRRERWQTIMAQAGVDARISRQ